MPNPKLTKLKEMLTLLSDSLTRKEFLDAFKGVIDFVKRVEQELMAKIDDRLTQISDGKDGEVGPKGDRGATGPKGDRGATGYTLFGKAESGKDGKDGSPDTPDEIIEKVNASNLIIDSERIEGLDNLDKRFDEIRTIAASRVQTPAKSYAIHKVDLSAQCDGANLTFNVGGSHFGIMGVYSTQAPIHFRPIIDYTETATGFTLIGITIQSGQTLVAQFLK